VRSRVKEHDDDVDGVEGVDGVVPFSEAVTLATVLASAPNDWRSVTIAWICVCESAAACAVPADANMIVATMATPATAATNFAVVVLVRVIRTFD
jgi:hypothetical protein